MLSRMRSLPSTASLGFLADFCCQIWNVISETSATFVSFYQCECFVAPSCC